MPFEIERKSSGGISREKFEKALLDRMTERGAGWDRPIAMVALALMFIARAISDVASAVKVHAAVTRRNGRER